MSTTTTTPAPIALTCSECGIGNYYGDPFKGNAWECDECGHHVSVSDIDLEAGESLTTDADGALAYITN